MLGRVSFSGTKLKSENLLALSSILVKCDHLRILELTNCQLDSSCLKALAEGLRGSNVRFDVLDVSFNRNLRKESLPYLFEICLRTRGLNYWQCGFKQIDLLTFDPNAEKIDTPELSRERLIVKLFKDHALLDCSKDAVCDHITRLKSILQSSTTKGRPITVRIAGYEAHDKIENLVDLIEACPGIDELEISECTFESTQLGAIGKALKRKEVQVKVVNVFLCPNMKADTWSALGEIARNSQTETLLITACGLTAPKLEGLQLALYPNQLFKLDVSRNEDMDEKCLNTLGNLVQNSGAEELIMAYCRISATNMRALEKSMTKVNLKRFDLSGNTTMGADGFAALASIVKNCKVEQLDVSECDPNGEQLKSFEATLGKAKLVKMNLSRNTNLTKEDGIVAIANIAKKTEIKELFMRQCDLDSQSLSVFKSALGATKIPKLDLGHYFMKDRSVTDEEIDVIVQLLDNIGEQLTLNKWALSDEQKARLIDGLNSFPSEEAPTIQLNRSLNDVLHRSEA